MNNRIFVGQAISFRTICASTALPAWSRGKRGIADIKTPKNCNAVQYILKCAYIFILGVFFAGDDGAAVVVFQFVAMY